jgi:hypothetical protein
MRETGEVLIEKLISSIKFVERGKLKRGVNGRYCFAKDIVIDNTSLLKTLLPEFIDDELIVELFIYSEKVDTGKVWGFDLIEISSSNHSYFARADVTIYYDFAYEAAYNGMLEYIKELRKRIHNAQ